jgi:hypothetical protein
VIFGERIFIRVNARPAVAFSDFHTGNEVSFDLRQIDALARGTEFPRVPGSRA